jgi:hypothetical protein
MDLIQVILNWASNHLDFITLMIFGWWVYNLISNIFKRENKKQISDKIERRRKWNDDWNVDIKMEKDRKIFTSKDFKQKRK